MKKNRSGSMLIQQIVLMSISGALFLVGTKVLHRGFQFAKDCRSQESQLLNTRRLAIQFRQDIQLSTQILNSSSEELELRLLDQSVVRFQFTPPIVRRSLLSEDASTVTGTEEFTLPKNWIAEFRNESERCQLTLSSQITLTPIDKSINGYANEDETSSSHSKVHLIVSSFVLPNNLTNSVKRMGEATNDQ